jgi:putative hydrolase of the HAD superfamily
MTNYLLFDYGGVIADHYCEPATSLLAELLGVTRKESLELVSERVDAGIDFRLSRITKAEFWNRIREKVPNKNFSDNEAQELWASSYIPNQAMLNLLNYVRCTYGIHTAILMNEDVDRFEHVQGLTDWSKHVDFFVSSHETGFLKPQKEAYLAAAERWGVNVDQILYIDDRAGHVEAAQALGMKGHTFQNHGELWKRLLKERELSPYRATPLRADRGFVLENADVTQGIQL